MSGMPVRVLIINKQLGFSVRIKQSLEQLGGFAVSPFTAADAALEYLQSNYHDVALVDFTMPGPTGADIVRALRHAQPNIPIIGSPEIPEVINAARSLGLDGVVDVPCSARELIPVIERVVATGQDVLPETAEAKPVQDLDTVLISEPDLPDAPEFSSLDSVLIRMGGMDYTVGTETVDVDMSDAAYAESDENTGTIEVVLKGDLTALQEQFEKPNKPAADSETVDAVDVFQRLAGEEPPLPELEDSGTIGDLKQEVSTSNLYKVIESIIEDHTGPNPVVPPHALDTTEAADDESDQSPQKPTKPSDLPGETTSPPPIVSLDDEPPIPEGATPAQLVLRSASDETGEGRITLQELLDSIQQDVPDEPSGGRALPPWMRDIDRYVREPDFLGDALPQLEDSTDNATTNTVELTDVDESGKLPAPPPGVPGMPDADQSDAGPLTAEETSQLQADLGSTSQQQKAIIAVEEDDDDIRSDDPVIAQMAVSLTQVALESTAEAVLLARGDEVVAYAGDLPLEDMARLHDTISGDWDANPNEARIRFTTLPDSGQDYMLYSRKTEGGFTLSMVFEGTLPLRNIRQQSNKIVDALHDVAVAPEDEAATAEELATIDELYQLEDAVAQEEQDAIESTQALVVTQADHDDIEISEAASSVVEPHIVTPAETGPLSPYTYLWMLRDPNLALSREAAQAVVVRLHDWLSSISWDVQILQVYEDYVYLMVGVPDDEIAQEIIRDLKEFSAKIVAQIDPVPNDSTLWADSYCFLTPGREMTQEEIQDFINFERMR